MYDFSRYANYLRIEYLTILQYVHETSKMGLHNKLHSPHFFTGNIETNFRIKHFYTKLSKLECDDI